MPDARASRPTPHAAGNGPEPAPATLATPGLMEALSCFLHLRQRAEHHAGALQQTLSEMQACIGGTWSTTPVSSATRPEHHGGEDVGPECSTCGQVHGHSLGQPGDGATSGADASTNPSFYFIRSTKFLRRGQELDQDEVQPRHKRARSRMEDGSVHADREGLPGDEAGPSGTSGQSTNATDSHGNTRATSSRGRSGRNARRG